MILVMLLIGATLVNISLFIKSNQSVTRYQGTTNRSSLLLEGLMTNQSSSEKPSITNFLERSSLSKAHKDICFIKLHRSGSGTFHNILVRFAINHDAFVALAHAVRYSVFPNQISRHVLLPEPTHPNFTGYNMFIDHALFNKSASDAILSKDVLYITQTREPLWHGRASYEKFNHDLIFSNKTPSELSFFEFMKDPDKHEPHATESNRNLNFSGAPNGSFFKNCLK